MKINAAIVFFVFTSSSNHTASSTAWQKELLQRVAVQAQQWSSSSTALLKARLESPKVRAALSVCNEEVAALPTMTILQRLREEVKAAEVVSGFQSTPHRSGFNWSYVGMTLNEGLHGLSFFENLWEAGLQANFSFHAESWFGAMDDVEIKFYGLRPFASRGRPSSMLEADERAVYTAVNLHRVDAGSPLYGDVSVVLSNAVADSMIISAVDTGGWQHLCSNASYKPPPGYEANCSVFKDATLLGTLSDFDHLFLASDDYWGGSLGSIACRLLAPWGRSELTGKHFVRYWEALPLTRLSYPSAIKFVIGTFPSLFGSTLGLRLQQWCTQNNWILVWSLGLNLDFNPFFWNIANSTGPFLSDQRVVDPLVLAHTTITNISLAKSKSRIFRDLWQEAFHFRNESESRHAMVPNSTWKSLWTQLRTSLPELRLRPMTAGACSDVSNCVGTLENGTCICYQRMAEYIDQVLV